ncbi:hypothetical protein VNO77_43652 [Canavalia gladiata]|uniref:Uncharacterized protein n=1 Tax=Canavalia gladiata TaxID=3824 RepID=A0AAN9JV72_CANGL
MRERPSTGDPTALEDPQGPGSALGSKCPAIGPPGVEISSLIDFRLLLEDYILSKAREHLILEDQKLVVAGVATLIPPTMVFRQSIVCFITFTYFLHLTEPSDLNQDTLLQDNTLTTSNTLISSSGLFTLSFFQFDSSQDFYLGIRLTSQNSSSSYYWVANRDKPIQDPASFLTIDQYGNLKIISNKGNSTIMLYYAEPTSNNNSAISAILQDTGNFVLREMNPDGSVKRELWKSFDYPADTLIPGMKLGFDRKTGLNWSLTSWRSDMSPMSGSFSLGIDPKTNQLVMWWRGKIVWSSGQWNSNGNNFGNLKSSIFQDDFSFKYYSDGNETYIKYASIYGWIVLGSLGTIIGSSGNSYSCVDHDKCFLSGCSMPNPPECRDHDNLYLGSKGSYGVMSRKGYKFDERENLTNFDCWMKCLNNCSCEAYSYVNHDATGCEIWSKGTANFLATIIL